MTLLKFLIFLFLSFAACKWFDCVCLFSSGYTTKQPTTLFPFPLCFVDYVADHVIIIIVPFDRLCQLSVLSPEDSLFPSHIIDENHEKVYPCRWYFSIRLFSHLTCSISFFLPLSWLLSLLLFLGLKFIYSNDKCTPNKVLNSVSSNLQTYRHTQAHLLLHNTQTHTFCL